MTLESYEFRDPGLIVATVAEQHPLTPGGVLLVLVRDPSTDQTVVQVTCLDPLAWGDLDDHELSRFFATQVQGMPVPEDWNSPAPRHSILTIVARRGRAIVSANETKWLMASHFSNHMVRAFDGGLIVVTEHGWTDLMSDLGGRRPALAVQPAARE